MEKVVLSKGYEFELIPNAVNVTGDTISITFKPGDKPVDELLNIWTGNDKMSVKIDETDIQVHSGYTVCKAVAVIPNYLIGTEYTCPKCNADIAPNATECAACGAVFAEGEAPVMKEIRANVCTVKCSIPDINARMTDVEDSVADIIGTILAAE